MCQGSQSPRVSCWWCHQTRAQRPKGCNYCGAFSDPIVLPEAVFTHVQSMCDVSACSPSQAPGGSQPLSLPCSPSLWRIEGVASPGLLGSQPSPCFICHCSRNQHETPVRPGALLRTGCCNVGVPSGHGWGMGTARITEGSSLPGTVQSILCEVTYLSFTTTP